MPESAEHTSSIRLIRYQLIAAVIALVGLISAGTVVYHYLEKWTWPSSFYFTVVTLTTVGYGDMVPTRDSTRVFTAIFIILGATVALASVTIIGTRYLEYRGVKVERRRTKRRQKREAAG